MIHVDLIQDLEDKLAQNQAKSPGVGQGTHLPARGPAQGHKAQRVGASEAQVLKRWVYNSRDEHGCSLKKARRT